jgi:tetratricopeptide (TPR) repeat protein
MSGRTAGFIVLGIAIACAAPGQSRAEDLSRCEALEVTTQTYDVNDSASAVPIHTVETNHFTPDVEHLLKGQTAPLPLDIAFVLRYIPNHYRALSAMANWQLKNRVPADMQSRVWTVDCYFERALVWRPNDPKVHFVYAIYLQKAARLADAVQEYAQAERLGASDAEFYYNRGLLEFDLGRLDAAREDADRAYSLGYPLLGLHHKLQRAAAGTPKAN